MGITFTGILIVAIFIFFVYYGMKIGLLKAVVDLTAFFMTFILTWLFYPKLAALLMKTPLREGIYRWLDLTLRKSDTASSSLPEFFMNLPNVIKDSIITSSKKAYDALITSTTEALTVLTINVISILVLFFLFRILSLMIRKGGKKINKVMFIGPINSLLGGTFGGVQGLLTIYLIAMILSYFPTTKIYTHVAKDLQVSMVGKVLFKENTKIMGITPRYPILKR